MIDTKSFTNLQLTALVVLRFFIGWHLLYEGISKFLSPNWSSIGFLKESQWIMSNIASWISGNSGVLILVDFLNTWGLIAIGAGLILGIFCRTAALAGAILLLLYYLTNPPLIGLEYSVPTEGNNLIINKTLIEAVSLFVLALFPTSHIIGLDLLFSRTKKEKLVQESSGSRQTKKTKHKILN
jgi:thiosulfate dehydrogenase [quinone] large subunit